MKATTQVSGIPDLSKIDAAVGADIVDVLRWQVELSEGCRCESHACSIGRRAERALRALGLRVDHRRSA